MTVVLKKFIEAENQKYYDDLDEQLLKQLVDGELDSEKIVKDTEKLYKEELFHFADKNCPTDQEIFSEAFHRLIHTNLLPEILMKEKEYAQTVSNLIKEMESETKILNKQHQDDMDLKIQQLDLSITSEDINNLLSSQFSAQSLLRKKFESVLESIRAHQRFEYRDYITCQLGEALMASKSPLPTPVVGNRSSMFVSQAPRLEESFTIHLGSQLKNSHNVRILCGNITDLCSPLFSEDNDELCGLNIALGLYSSSLCGTVVLTPPSSSLLSVNEKIVRNANLSTEFHFDQIDDQLEKIQDHLKQVNENNETAKLKPGDFFITKHSNLAQSHILFHLISDETFQSTEINSRNPVILGLRNILKVASRYDITMLTIPALLRHEMSEEMTVVWCLRRAELGMYFQSLEKPLKFKSSSPSLVVFKCAKGFMIESSSGSGALLSTLQLLLPDDISEELFMNLSTMVPNIFRVSNPKVLQS